MKRLIPALIAATLMSGGAFAQSINIGPGGVGIDPRSPRERSIDRAERHDDRTRREEWRDRRDRREWRAERRGRDCRTVTTREETRRGVVKRTTRVCD